MRRITAFVLLASAAGAENWPQFRGPRASGIGESKDPPRTWNAPKSENVLWKTPIPGLAVSSPIVWGNRVFVTTAISSDPKAVFRHGLYGDVEPSPDVSKHVWKVYALDAATGKILWEETAFDGVPKTKRHPKSSQASSTPATDGKHVVAYFGSEGLFVYTVDGKLRWKKDLGIQNAGWFFDPDYEWAAASSPVIHKNMVIVQCDRQKDSFITALDIETGKELWRTAREEIPTWGTPTIYEGKSRTELITNGTKAVRGYDPATGKELWRLAPNSEVTCTTPVAADELIYVTNGYPPVRPVWAIRAGASGDISLKGDAESSDAIAWSKKNAGVYLPSPLVYAGCLYTLSNNGVLTCYQAKTGERVYQERVAQGGSYSAAPVAAGDHLYLTSEDGDIHVVKAGPKYELVATNPMGEVLMATPAFSGDRIFIRGRHHVFAVGK